MLFLFAGILCFGQASALRDYVGLIKINYHSDVIELMNKFKSNLEKRGYSKDAKAIENYLQGISGSGFVYVAADGSCYILTNEHVVSQADSLSVTFERTDGAKTTYDGLKIFYVDEDKDLAILYFENGIKPFTQGLSFNITPPEEGSTVFAAGFPGMGNTAAWQYSQGIISNANIRLQKYADSDELFGPFIQHTAQVDPGNSGGPLLVAKQGVPTNHAVIGINTLSARWRQAANYAIPVDQINVFIASALSSEPVDERQLLAKRVDEFIKGLGANKYVYDHIAEYLSNGCTATNAEYAIYELLEKAPRAVIQDIDRIFSTNPVDGMNAAVAWYIENSMRPRTGDIKISLDSIDTNDLGNFVVSFNVNGSIVKSEWVKEYGVYRLNTYGDIATGEKSRMESRLRTIEQNQALKTNYILFLTAGYSNVFDYGSALNLSLNLGIRPFTYGLELHSVLGDTKYSNIATDVGIMIPIRLKIIAITPFGGIGTGAIFTRETVDSLGFTINLSLRGGLMFTTSAVPGLFLRAYYTHNFTVKIISNLPNHGILGFSAGFGL